MFRIMRRRPHRGQIEMEFPSWGGARRGAGRKPNGPRPMMPHLPRTPARREHPVHLSIKLLPARRSLRTYTVLAVLRQALRDLHGKHPGFRVVNYSLQDNHLHTIAEADTPRQFASGVISLCTRVAKRLNRVLGRKGRIFADRHYRRVLRTPREVRNCLAYVLNNWRHHLAAQGRLPGGQPMDPFSSAATFDGWAECGPRGPPEGDVRAPQTWLCTEGWRRQGLISLVEIPGPPPRW